MYFPRLYKNRDSYVLYIPKYTPSVRYYLQTLFCYKHTYIYAVRCTVQFFRRELLWWKKYLTGLQMVQFVAVILHAMFPLVLSDCNYPKVKYIYKKLFMNKKDEYIYMIQNGLFRFVKQEREYIYIIQIKIANFKDCSLIKKENIYYIHYTNQNWKG